MKNKYLDLTLMLTILIVILGALMTYSYIKEGNSQNIIGGDKDSHGCLGPAGYSWNSSIGACIREWELDSNKKEAAKVAIGPISYPVTILEVKALECSGCFKVEIQRNDNQNKMTIELNDWKYVFKDCKNYTYSDCRSNCAVCPPCEVCSSLSCNT
ncbi:Uncharacterised protein [uncultured archaeon]|nr:Uncharacterised protein [uncultured archaeon]